MGRSEYGCSKKREYFSLHGHEIRQTKMFGNFFFVSLSLSLSLSLLFLFNFFLFFFLLLFCCYFYISFLKYFMMKKKNRFGTLSLLDVDMIIFRWRYLCILLVHFFEICFVQTQTDVAFLDRRSVRGRNSRSQCLCVCVKSLCHRELNETERERECNSTPE